MPTYMKPIRPLLGFLLLFASVGCDDPATQPVAGDELASFTVSTDQLPADGEVTTILRAIIPATARVEPRQVTFSTTAGTLSGSNSQNVIVPVGPTGEAVAILKAPSAPTLALVSARAGGTVLFDSIRFVTAPPALQSLTVGAREVPSDGATTVTVRAVLSPQASARTVRFGSTSGHLMGTGGSTDSTIAVPTDSNGTALVLLRADTALGVALVRASAGVTTLVDSVRFVRAFPDHISITTDSFQAISDPTRRVTLTAKLTRSVGRVTRGATVEFVAARPDGTWLGTFSGASPSDQNGMATVTYTPGSTDYVGRVIITAQTVGTTGAVLSATTSLEVRPAS